jgi:hypothetical protein
MSGTVSEIPLSGTPQFFTIALAGTTYQLVFTYRDAPGGGWVMDINDAQGNPIACGIPLVTGTDLLAQFGYLNFGGQLWVKSDGVPDALPTFDNLGTGSHLYWVMS